MHIPGTRRIRTVPHTGYGPVRTSVSSRIHTQASMGTWQHHTRERAHTHFMSNVAEHIERRMSARLEYTSGAKISVGVAPDTHFSVGLSGRGDEPSKKSKSGSGVPSRQSRTTSSCRNPANPHPHPIPHREPLNPYATSSASVVGASRGYSPIGERTTSRARSQPSLKEHSKCTARATKPKRVRACLAGRHRRKCTTRTTLSTSRSPTA